MSSFKALSGTRTLLALAILAPILAGCGFRPLYGRHDDDSANGPISEKMAAVRIVVTTTRPDAQDGEREGQMLRNQLISHLNPKGEPVKPEFTLTIKLDSSMAGLGQRKDATATLGEVSMNAKFVLQPKTTEDGKPGKGGMSGVSSSVVSANFLGARYASVSAERDARSRALSELSDDIALQIAAYLRNPASKAPLSSQTKFSEPTSMPHYQILQPSVPLTGPESP